MNWRDYLNDEQYKIVTSNLGPILVIAGAGSGKTRVLTYRVGFLIEELNFDSSNILAVTFTNKAANEMKERLKRLFGRKAENLNVGTIHSRCAYILREDGKHIGIDPNYTIYTRDDVKAVIKPILTSIKSFLQPNQAISLLSGYKMGYIEDNTGELEEIYEEYQTRMRELNALDFDDLLLYTKELFENNEEIRKKYANLYKYVLLDEFQDVNRIQYEILHNIAKDHQNFFAVGDEDQSIYGFRGADVDLIREFENDFPKVNVFYLENNYRSNRYILEKAMNLIDNNYRKYKKILKPNHNEGRPVDMRIYDDMYDEVNGVLRIVENMKYEGVPYKEIAILFRTNFQTRRFEESFIRNGIPYKLFGAVTFYQRKEIQDILSYLRLLVNPYDELSFVRLSSVPKRGIGKTSLQKFFAFSKNYNGMLEGLDNIDKLNVSAKIKKGFFEIASLYNELKKINPHNVGKIGETLVDRIDYEEYLYSVYDDNEAYGRWQNVLELIRGMQQWDKGDIGDYLREISLYTSKDDDIKDDAVIMATVHNAKGLEFDCVIIPELIEGMFPHHRSIEEDDDIEEERRLMYVAMTRARKFLYISSYRFKMMKNYGIVPAVISRFWGEIEGDKKDKDLFSDNYNYSENRVKSIRVGDYVYHKDYGRGKVVSIKNGLQITIKVRFGFDYKEFPLDSPHIVKEG